jgi:hypothetical protein
MPVDVENAVSADPLRPLLDTAKTDHYAIKGNEAKREGFLAGYGQLPINWRERVELYKLYYALELWDWFDRNREQSCGCSLDGRHSAFRRRLTPSLRAGATWTR